MFLNRWDSELFIVGRLTYLRLLKKLILYTNFKIFIKSQPYQLLKHQEAIKLANFSIKGLRETEFFQKEYGGPTNCFF